MRQGWLLACALVAPAIGCAESVPANTAKASVTRGSKADVMNQLAAALGRGGHACKIDEDTDAICDGDRRDAPSIVVSYHSGRGGIHLTFVAAFPWKQPDPCAQLLKDVNAFNGRARDFYVVCTPEGLTLHSALSVPETGLGDRDVWAFANWWSSAAVLAAAAPPFGPLLK